MVPLHTVVRRFTPTLIHQAAASRLAPSRLLHGSASCFQDGLPAAQAGSGVNHGGGGATTSEATSSVRSSAYSPIRTKDLRRRELVDEMIRVDHAGEVGAVQIYAGQLWALRGTKDYELVKSMKAGEEEHLATMNKLMAERRVRPTALLPLWQAAGFVLGAASALLGPRGAMACTVAVETVIGAHYNDQIRQLLAEGYDDERELMAVFKRHRDEELGHLDTGVAHGAEKAPLYKPMSAAVQAGCAAAIEVARRI